MFKAKKIILLVAAILLIFGCVSGGIVAAVNIEWEPVFDSIMVCLCIAGTVVGIIMCCKFNKPSKALTITAICILGMMSVAVIIGVASGIDMVGTEYFQIPLMFMLIGPFVAALCLRGGWGKQNQPAQQQQPYAPSPQAFCNKCGKPNAQDAMFCSGCGQAMRVVCPKCQKAIRTGTHFCDGCGTKIE